MEATTKVCANEKCKKEFTTKNERKIYCCRHCGDLSYGRLRGRKQMPFKCMLCGQPVANKYTYCYECKTSEQVRFGGIW